MKILTCASPRGTKLFGKYYEIIYQEAKRLGYVQIDDDIIQLTSDAFILDMEKGGTKAYADLYKRRTEAIQEADICLFESSLHSLGIGFLIEHALKNGKPTIVMYYKDNTPYFLSGVEDEKLIVKGYNDKNIKKVLKDAIELARERRDKRFNFFLSPKLLDYLEVASKKEGITKSKLIRDLIVRHMRDNNEGE